MDLITTANDPRLDPESVMVEDDPAVLRTSCRAALLAKEEAEGKVCRVRSLMKYRPCPTCRATGTIISVGRAIQCGKCGGEGKLPDAALHYEDLEDALSSPAPCSHAEKAKRLKAAMEWIIDHLQNPANDKGWRDRIVAELRRRCAEEGE